MTRVCVLIPVLGRPWRVPELLQSLVGSERTARLVPLFLLTSDDQAEREAVYQSGAWNVTVELTRQPGSYARKINHGARLAADRAFEWVFLAADDLCFCPGWADEAIREGERHKALVVGTNDLGNAIVMSGQHATHSLVHVSYLEQGTIDEPGKLLHEGYDHQFVDPEFCQTAMARGVWCFARDSMVEHLHHLWPAADGGRRSQKDATYELGEARVYDDARLFQSRQRLWQQAA